MISFINIYSHISTMEEVLDSIKTFVFPLLEGEVKTKWNPEKDEWDEKPF